MLLAIRHRLARDSQAVGLIILSLIETVGSDVNFIPVLGHCQEDTGKVDRLLFGKANTNRLKVGYCPLRVLGGVDPLASDISFDAH
jgi:hypothetical protein